MYELKNIFESFLPQLLSYPNPDDPLNIDAANLYKKNLDSYKSYVKQHVKKFSLKKTDNKMEIEEDFQKVKKTRKISTDCEDLNYSSVISHESELSELSDTSGIFFEDELF